jgi:hypothetical protein
MIWKGEHGGKICGIILCEVENGKFYDLTYLCLLRSSWGQFGLNIGIKLMEMWWKDHIMGEGGEVSWGRINVCINFYALTLSWWCV